MDVAHIERAKGNFGKRVALGDWDMSKSSKGLSRVRLVALAAAVTMMGTLGAVAEEPIATELSAIDAEAYIGVWVLDMEFRGNPVQMVLDIVKMGDKVGATLDSVRQPEPKAIDKMAIEEGMIRLDYRMKFGNRAFPIMIRAKVEQGFLVGTLGDENGIFSTEIKATKHLGDAESLVQGERPAPTATRIKVDGEEIRITFGDVPVDSADYAALDGVKVGEVVRFTEHRAMKLFTDHNIKFGDTLIKKENMAKDYPGVYSVWLKKTVDGWSLVFNEEADIWGTRHNPEADVAEIALTSGETDETAETFGVVLEEVEEGGRVRMAWGDREWSASFSIVQ